MGSSFSSVAHLFSAMNADKSHTAQREYMAPQPEMSAGRYAATRLTTLKPAHDTVPNPLTLLRMLNLQQWLFFLVAFFAWSWDAFDFFTVSLTVEPLAESFGKTKADITWGITLVWAEVAVHHQQCSLHCVGTRNWVLYNVQTILGSASVVWNRHGRFVWECCCYR
jgi:hypothetical protein